jgi:hypothetical protein
MKETGYIQTFYVHAKVSGKNDIVCGLCKKGGKMSPEKLFCSTENCLVS